MFAAQDRRIDAVGRAILFGPGRLGEPFHQPGRGQAKRFACTDGLVAVDRLQNILAGYRATPILYIGTDEFGSTAILGFYKDFSIAISYFAYSVCTIEIEGLI